MKNNYVNMSNCFVGVIIYMFNYVKSIQVKSETYRIVLEVKLSSEKNTLVMSQ